MQRVRGNWITKPLLTLSGNPKPKLYVVKCGAGTNQESPSSELPQTTCCLLSGTHSPFLYFKPIERSVPPLLLNKMSNYTKHLHPWHRWGDWGLISAPERLSHSSPYCPYFLSAGKIKWSIRVVFHHSLMWVLGSVSFLTMSNLSSKLLLSIWWEALGTERAPSGQTKCPRVNFSLVNFTVGLPSLSPILAFRGKVILSRDMSWAQHNSNCINHKSVELLWLSVFRPHACLN